MHCHLTEGEGGQARDKEQGKGRYGVRLLKQSPEKFRRMRSVLGYYQRRSADKSEEAPVKQVTVSLLQTLRHLNLDPNLKRRLLNYRILSLNRDLEVAYAGTRKFLQEGAGAKGAAGAGQGSAATSAMPGFLKRVQG